MVLVELDGHPPPAFGRPVLLFQRVPEEKAGTNRVHVDVVEPAGDAAAEEVTRLVALGATVVEQAQDQPWVVIADPEHNEFCVRAGSRVLTARPTAEQAGRSRRTSLTALPPSPPWATYLV